MNDQAWNLILIIGGIVGACAGIGAAIALIVASFHKSRNDYIRQDNIDLKNRVETLEHENELLKAGRTADQARITILEEKAEALTELVTQRADVSQLLADVQGHNTKAEERWRVTDGYLKASEALLTQLLASTNALVENGTNGD